MPSASPGLSSHLEFPQESPKSLRGPFFGAPPADLPDVHTVSERNLDRRLQALPVRPVVIDGEAIPTRVGCRKSSDLRAVSADAQPDRSDSKVAPNSERTRRKLDEEFRFSMKVLIPATREPNLGHCLVQHPPRGRGLNQEVQVLGLILTSCVNRGASAADEHGPNARPIEGVGQRFRDLGEARFPGDLQSRFPVLLGRRRSWFTRSRRSVSGSASRSR
jgi:hypothetical protein